MTGTGIGIGVGPIEAVRVFTHDITLARKFYARGLGLREKTSGPGYALFVTGGADLILEQVDEDDPESGDLVGRVLGFSFTVEDCVATCRELTGRGVDVVSAPELQAWGGVLAFVEDPDGNVLTLVQHQA
jgi:catechol 2,3-dioxygenase-like lactoylglutathione lyase family enzyme